MEYEEPVQFSVGKEDAETDEGECDLPSPGHVRSLVSKLESALEAPGSHVKDGPNLPIKNGKPVFSARQVPVFAVGKDESRFLGLRFLGL